jgi:hypothetical protein
MQVGNLHTATASVTELVGGEDCVIATGLCGRLRAWRASRASPSGVRLSIAKARAGSVQLSIGAAPAECEWKLVLDESSAYELANKRQSTHPYRYLSQISDHQFAVGTTEPTGCVHVWCTKRWVRTQLIDPAQSEEGLAERERRGCQTVRAAHSCLALAHGYLVCGSREGQVRLWRRRGTDELVRRFGTLRADCGPVAAAVITGEVAIVAYRSTGGFIDGSSFEGQQSVCAWSLGTGQLLWKHSPSLAEPVLGALGIAGRLVVLHAAEMPPADCEWSLVLHASSSAAGAGSPPSSSAPSALFLRSTPMDHSGGGGSVWSALRRGAAIGGSGSLLAWHSHDESVGEARGAPALLALGFAGGAVALLAASAVGASSAKPPYSIASASPAGGADVGAVLALSVASLQQRSPGQSAYGFLLSGDATGRVRLWMATRGHAMAPPEGGGGYATSTLVLLRDVLTLTVPRQPTALAMAGNTLLCGCTDGSLISVVVDVEADAAMVDLSDVHAVGEEKASVGTGGSSHSYEWLFDTGTGPQGRGTLRERRRAFDGWARTAAYEQGLQEVLAKMNQQRGEQSIPGAGKQGGSQSASAANASSFLKRGMHVQLTGLQGRPELNGSIGALLGGVESDSGRAPVKIVAPPEHAGKTLKVKPANLRIAT